MAVCDVYEKCIVIRYQSEYKLTILNRSILFVPKEKKENKKKKKRKRN